MQVRARLISADRGTNHPGRRNQYASEWSQPVDVGKNFETASLKRPTLNFSRADEPRKASSYSFGEQVISKTSGVGISVRALDSDIALRANSKESAT